MFLFFFFFLLTYLHNLPSRIQESNSILTNKIFFHAKIKFDLHKSIATINSNDKFIRAISWIFFLIVLSICLFITWHLKLKCHILIVYQVTVLCTFPLKKKSLHDVNHFFNVWPRIYLISIYSSPLTILNIQGRGYIGDELEHLQHRAASKIIGCM